MDAGLATVWDDARLVRRLLVMFRDSRAEFGEIFRAARRAGDNEAARRCAHTLKGVAANIGAGGVRAAASAAAGARAMDAEAFRSTLARLRALIADDDTEAGDVISELTARHGLEGYDAKSGAISASVEAFEFEQALRDIDALVDALDGAGQG